VWVVDRKVMTFSLYKEGSRVVYRHEIDADALRFAQEMVRINPDYSPAYAIDICKTESGQKLLETYCINAAGVYPADLSPLAAAIEALSGE